MDRLPWPWLAHQLEHAGLPLAHGPRGRVRQPRRAAPQVVVAEQLGAGRVGGPRRAGLLGGRVGGRARTSASTPRLERLARGRRPVLRLALARPPSPGRAAATPSTRGPASARRCPTNSCQRASTSPRSREPSPLASSTSASAPSYAVVDRRDAAARRPRPGRRRPRRARTRGRPATGPRRRGCAARRPPRTAASAAMPCSQVRIGSMTSGGSMRVVRGRLGHDEQRGARRARCSVSIVARCAAHLVGRLRRAPGRARPRPRCPGSTASRRNSHGTASA